MQFRPNSITQLYWSKKYECDKGSGYVDQGQGSRGHGPPNSRNFKNWRTKAEQLFSSEQKKIKMSEQRIRVPWTSEDSMISDFTGRRPLPARDYVVSIDGPKLWNHVSKVWRLLVWRNKTDEKLDVKTSFFVIILTNMDSPNFWLFILQWGTISNQNHTVPDWQGSAAHEIVKIIESPLGYTFGPILNTFKYRDSDEFAVRAAKRRHNLTDDYKG